MNRICLWIYLIFFVTINALHRRCINSGVSFSERTLSSPIVVYGQTISKKIDLDSNTELLYNVTFRVDCILKGQDIEQQIEITEAGIKSGHTACQYLHPGHFYVIFLEKWGTNINSYRPLDFPEFLVDNTTEEILAKTCHLTRIPPMHSITNKCPKVSMIEHCPHDRNDVNIPPSEKDSSPMYPMTKSSYFSNENQFYLQSNVTVLKSQSMEYPINQQRSNDAINSTTFPCFFSLILSIVFHVIFCE